MNVKRRNTVLVVLSIPNGNVSEWWMVSPSAVLRWEIIVDNLFSLTAPDPLSLALEPDSISWALFICQRARIWGACMSVCVCEYIGIHVFVIPFRCRCQGRDYYLHSCLFLAYEGPLGGGGRRKPGALLLKRQFSFTFAYVKCAVSFFLPLWGVSKIIFF